MSMFARVVSSTLLRASGGGSGNRNGDGAPFNAGSASSPTPAHGNVGTAYNQSSDSLSALQSPLDTPSPDHEDGRSPAFHGHGGHGAVGSTDDSRRARSERRVMPARLRRVSSLLAGSIEEEIAYAAAKEEEDSSIPGSTAIVLTTDERTPCQTFALGIDDAMMAHGVRGEEIQTPDFRTRDDLEVMGKTRSMRSEEDTSDAAFERRHRKADNMEKRLRKWEKENLKKDRQKIVDRIEQLRSADVRVLEPILAAREKGIRAVDDTSIESNENDDEAKQLTQIGKLESLRDDLIKQHKSVLRRYDALLTVPLEENVGGTATGKRKAAAAAHHDASEKPRRVINVSGAFARKSIPNVVAAAAPAAASAMTASIKPSASMSALPDEAEKKPNTKYSARDIKARRLSLQDKTPKPFLDADGKVRAENTYANIHARTNGGRFAPKSALGSKSPSGPRSKINTKTGRPKSQQGLSRSARRAASAASVASTGTDKTDEDVDLKTEVPVKRGPGRPRKDGSSSASKPSPTGRPRGRPPRSSTTSQTTAVDDEDVKMNNEETPRTRRVKLTFNRNKSDQNAENDPARVAKTEDDDDDDVLMRDLTGKKGNQEMDSESEADAALSTSTTPARAALTLEQAQALFAQALADGDDDAKDEADAAAYIFPSSSH